jgi:dihydrofolate synthase/folylpolyglutamate synthase
MRKCQLTVGKYRPIVGNNRHPEPEQRGMDSVSLTQWLARLETRHPNPIDLGLERVARVARALGLIPVEAPVVTVAGTNGKGSTVAVLEAILSQCGQRAGVFTSPHMLRFNERIRVGEEEASDAEIVAAFAAIDTAREGTSLTYFEFATLAALQVFRTREVDVLVLEVGLGGRLDAVNIVDPTVAVITCIDLDHQDWLGDDRGRIAREKGGIMRGGVPVVIGDRQPPQELIDCAEAVGAQPILRLGHEFGFDEKGGGWEGKLLDTHGMQRTLPQQPRTSLVPDNVCAGLQAAVQLGCEFDSGQLSAALKSARPRGRCERFPVADYEVVLDVAHNPNAVYNLVEYLDITPCKGKTISIFSAMVDKDIGAMIKAAGHSFDSWLIAEQPDNPRAAAAVDIAQALQREGQVVQSISGNICQAFRRAQDLAASGDRLVVFGSFSTVAEVLPMLEPAP